MKFNRLAASLFIAASFASSGAAYAQSVNAPTFVAGESWQYQSYDQWTNKLTSRLDTKVLGVAGDYVRMHYETTMIGASGELTKPTVADATVRSELNAYVMYHGERMEKVFYQWPMSPGKRWTYQYKTDMPLTGTATTPSVMTTNVNAEILGWETVDVPAGKFKALKIVYKTNWSVDNPASSGTSISTQWYSPDTKSEVQSMFEALGADGLPQARTMRQLALYKADAK